MTVINEEQLTLLGPGSLQFMQLLHAAGNAYNAGDYRTAFDKHFEAVLCCKDKWAVQNDLLLLEGISDQAVAGRSQISLSQGRGD